jgi:hypothetical protein
MPSIIRPSGGVEVAVENRTPASSPGPGLEQGPIARWVVVDIVVVLCVSYDYPLKIIIYNTQIFSALFILLIAGFTCVAYYKFSSRSPQSANQDHDDQGDGEQASSFSVPLSDRDSSREV